LSSFRFLGLLGSGRRMYLFFSLIVYSCIAILLPSANVSTSAKAEKQRRKRVKRCPLLIRRLAYSRFRRQVGAGRLSATSVTTSVWILPSSPLASPVSSRTTTTNNNERQHGRRSESRQKEWEEGVGQGASPPPPSTPHESPGADNNDF
jgi:hypothetical protein